MRYSILAVSIVVLVGTASATAIAESKADNLAEVEKIFVNPDSPCVSAFRESIAGQTSDASALQLVGSAENADAILNILTGDLADSVSGGQANIGAGGRNVLLYRARVTGSQNAVLFETTNSVPGQMEEKECRQVADEVLRQIQGEMENHASTQ